MAFWELVKFAFATMSEVEVQRSTVLYDSGLMPACLPTPEVIVELSMIPVGPTQRTVTNMFAKLITFELPRLSMPV